MWVKISASFLGCAMKWRDESAIFLVMVSVVLCWFEYRPLPGRWVTSSIGGVELFRHYTTDSHFVRCLATNDWPAVSTFHGVWSSHPGSNRVVFMVCPF